MPEMLMCDKKQVCHFILRYIARYIAGVDVDDHSIAPYHETCISKPFDKNTINCYAIQNITSYVNGSLFSDYIENIICQLPPHEYSGILL
jgi:hypothetical protein